MSHTLTETPTKGTAVVVPDDGDGATGAAFAGPYQALTNRVAFCEAAVDSLGGNHPIKVVAAPASLTAIASPANGDTRIVPGNGVYRFVSGSTATAFSPWIITHASGRWIHVDYDNLADSATGDLFALLVSGKLPLARHTNGIVRTSETAYSGTWGNVIAGASFTTAAWTNSSVDHLESSLVVGDIVEIQATVHMSASSIVPAYAWARLRVIDDAPGAFGGPTTTDYTTTEVRVDGSTAQQRILRVRHVATKAGQLQAIVQLQANGADAARLLYPSRINATVVRP